MSECDVRTEALPFAHAALVRRVIRLAYGRPDALLILGDHYEQFADYLDAAGFVRAAIQATACADHLRAAVKPAPACGALRRPPSFLETLIMQRSS